MNSAPFKSRINIAVFIRNLVNFRFFRRFSRNTILGHQASDGALVTKFTHSVQTSAGFSRALVCLQSRTQSLRFPCPAVGKLVKDWVNPSVNIGLSSEILSKKKSETYSFVSSIVRSQERRLEVQAFVLITRAVRSQASRNGSPP